MLNIIENLKDVKVQIFHGNLNKDFIMSELQEFVDNIILTNLDKDNQQLENIVNVTDRKIL